MAIGDYSVALELDLRTGGGEGGEVEDKDEDVPVSSREQVKPQESLQPQNPYLKGKSTLF